MKTVKQLKRKHRDRVWFGKVGELWFYENGKGWAVISSATNEGSRLYYNFTPDTNEGPFTEVEHLGLVE